MAPTLKDSSSRFSSDSAGPTGGVASADEAKSSQPVALEVPVTVNGARTVEGSDKREPFSENTSTVLIFANGAVIRLNSAVTAGQLLFLTNEKTRKEVVCQVVKSKNYRSSGYVELEFTEPVSGFWGMRFPGERPGLQAAPRSAAKQSSDLSADKDLKLGGDAKPAAPVATTPESPREFKAEIKADSRPGSKADFLAPSEAPTVAPRLESNLLQEQLSALLSSEPAPNEQTPRVTAPKEGAIEIEAEPIEIEAEETPVVVEGKPASIVSAAPVTTPTPTASATPPPKSSFEDEEVKIPAWLQPLARNESVMSPTPVEDSPAPAPAEKSSAPSESIAHPRHVEPVRRPSSSAAVFGNALLGEASPAPAHARSGTGKGPWIGALAAAVLVAAGAAWNFRDSLGVAQRNSGASQLALPTAVPSSQSTLPNSAATPNAASSSVESSSPEFSSQTSKPTADGRIIDSSSSSPASGKLQTAAISERIPKASSSVDSRESSGNEENHIVVVEPEKRPALGTVHLAKPKVSHSTGGQVGSTTEPTLEAGNQSPIADSSFNSGLVTGSNQEPVAPAARVEVGGDVRTARMISSVPPTYPALAKAQHISGDVRIDALIDANGRVTTMKIVSGPTLLHQAAMDALRQWKYQPATLDGKPVAMHLAVTIQFRLQ